MLQRGRLIARLVSCAVSIFFAGILGLSQTPAPAAKTPEPTAIESAKPADAKVAESVDKEKKAADAVPDKQKQLADDTAKLLVLANELKAEMDKSTKDTLSLTVVKKAEEVEKLAHKVRDEMKKSMGN